MALEYTYGSLLNATERWLEEEGVEFIGEGFPVTVGLAEQRILKDLQISTFDVLLAGTFVTDDPALPKPDEVVQAVALFLVENRYRTIVSQDETDFDGAGNNGTFIGGSGYAALDTITMTDGTVVLVDTVASGVVTEFTITSITPIGSGSLIAGSTLEQDTTSADGIGFELTLGTANETKYTLGSKRAELHQRTMSFLRDYQDGVTIDGEPSQYCDEDEDNWIVDPIPDAPYDYEALCILRPKSLLEYLTIAAQSEADFDGTAPNGSFTGGSGYAGSDTITLNDGTVITVDTVSGGAVTEFTVTTATPAGSGTSVRNATLTQASTSGGGTGFTLTLGSDNEVTNDSRSTWISTRLAELLFYAVLIEGEGFIMADGQGEDRSSKWRGEYDSSLNTSRYEMKRWAREAYMPMQQNQGGE